MTSNYMGLQSPLGLPPLGLQGNYPQGMMVSPMNNSPGYLNPMMNMNSSIMPDFLGHNSGSMNSPLSDDICAGPMMQGYFNNQMQMPMTAYNSLPNPIMPYGMSSAAWREYDSYSIPALRGYGADNLEYDADIRQRSLENSTKLQEIGLKSNAKINARNNELQERAMQSSLERQTRMNQAQLNAQVQQQHQIRAAGFLTQSRQDAMAMQIASLKLVIQNNDQDAISKEFGKLVNLCKQDLQKTGVDISKVSPQEFKAYAARIYCEQGGGTSLIDDINSHGRSPFTQGFFERLFIVNPLVNKKTKADNIADITGIELSQSDKYSRVAGNILGGILTIPLGILALKGGCKTITNIPKIIASIWNMVF